MRINGGVRESVHLDELIDQCVCGGEGGTIGEKRLKVICVSLSFRFELRREFSQRLTGERNGSYYSHNTN